MKYERFGNCLTKVRQKSWCIYQNLTDLVYVNRCHSLLTVFVPEAFSTQCQAHINYFVVLLIIRIIDNVENFFLN